MKPTTFKRWNETLFQNFCDTYWLSKMLFKNDCINPILKDKVLTMIFFVFCKKCVLKSLNKVLQQYVQLSSYLVNKLWVWMLLNFCLFFDSAKEPSSDVTNFLNMRFITTQKPAFFRKYYMLTSSQVKKISLKTLRRK